MLRQFASGHRERALIEIADKAHKFFEFPHARPSRYPIEMLNRFTCGMDKLTVVFFTLAIFSCTTTAQRFSNQNGDPARPATKKTVTLIGNVSQDRMFIHDNDDQEWAVANPASLKGHEGAAVVVRCLLNATQNSIHILSVKADQATYSARIGDSAFRR